MEHGEKNSWSHVVLLQTSLSLRVLLKPMDFYEFSGKDDKTTIEHISIYLSQLGFAGKEDYMRVQNFPLSLTGTAFAWFTSLP